jgi:L-2-hydroxyglutarate oxidase LhgO
MPESPRDVDVVVVGAGMVGLACAAGLARAGRSVLLLERGEEIARETTSRNSEVVHAGIYYEPGSLKATLCVAGRRALYARCGEQGIAHRRLGKLIVATDDGEVEALEKLKSRAAQNDVRLELLDAARVRRMEPEVRALAALWSPETGVVDGHALALSYLAEAETHGAVLMRRAELLELEPVAGSWRARLRNADAELETLVCAAVVNAAGLAADRVAALAGMDIDALGYRLHYCKGDYFALAPGRGLQVEHLIYPLPADPRSPGLGVHVTLDLAGRVRFGPDAEYVSELGYRVDAAKASAFAQAVSRYLPAVEPDWLVPDFAGIRPKLAGPGEGFRDFVVAEESAAGFPGLVNCLGIESPGLTAAGAIAERVVTELAGL